MWDLMAHKLALLELVTTGQLRRRKSQITAWDWLAELSWTRRSGRRDEITLDDARSPEAKKLLEQVWADWKQVLVELEAAGLPASERGWRQLQDIERSRAAVGLPHRLNRRTALAQIGSHSKTTLSQTIRETLADTDLTHDGTARLRPSSGLQIHCGDHTVSAERIAALLGEVILTERALIAGTVFGGALPRLLLTVENLGPYLDIQVPADCLVAHVPGWNTRTIRMIFDLLPAVPVVHFGDLDPNGVRIIRHIKALKPDAEWLVPSFWSESVATKGMKVDWPSNLDLADTPRLVQELARAGVWLEQESVSLDPRLKEAVDATARTINGQ